MNMGTAQRPDRFALCKTRHLHPMEKKNTFIHNSVIFAKKKQQQVEHCDLLQFIIQFDLAKGSQLT